MELQILSLSKSPHCKEMYLQHINEMINIKLHKGDTYNTLFLKLQERFFDNEDKLRAINDWIKFNKQQQDNSVFDTVFEEDCYAVFNLQL